MFLDRSTPPSIFNLPFSTQVSYLFQLLDTISQRGWHSAGTQRTSTRRCSCAPIAHTPLATASSTANINDRFKHMCRFYATKIHKIANLNTVKNCGIRFTTRSPGTTLTEFNRVNSSKGCFGNHNTVNKVLVNSEIKKITLRARLDKIRPLIFSFFFFFNKAIL